MPQDRYVKGLLTVIALALIYLCVVLTPAPPALAQVQTQPPLVKPGDVTGPMPSSWWGGARGPARSYRWPSPTPWPRASRTPCRWRGG